MEKTRRVVARRSVARHLPHISLAVLHQATPPLESDRPVGYRGPPGEHGVHSPTRIHWQIIAWNCMGPGIRKLWVRRIQQVSELSRYATSAFALLRDGQWMARPTVKAIPNASCSRPVWPSVAISPGPATPLRTARTGAMASGTAISAISVNGR